MRRAEKVWREALSSRASCSLALRMSGWVVVLPLAKRVVSIERLAQVMWRGANAERNLARERLTIRLATRLTRFSGGNCLERSLILYRYLSLEGAEPTLVLGFGNAQNPSGHAWVVVDGAPVIDSPGTLASYDPVVAFGRDARRTSPEVLTPPTRA